MFVSPTALGSCARLAIKSLMPVVLSFWCCVDSSFAPTNPCVQALHKALTSWRAEAAAAGSLPVLTSLTQAEVSGVLSQVQADAVGRAVMQLEAAARLCVRQAAACRLDLAGLSPSEVDALAWRVHTGGQQAAEELVELLLVQVGWLVTEGVCGGMLMMSSNSSRGAGKLGCQSTDLTA